MKRGYNINHAVSILDKNTKIYKTQGCNHINRFALDLYRNGLLPGTLGEMARLHRESEQESEIEFERIFYDKNGNVNY